MSHCVKDNVGIVSRIVKMTCVRHNCMASGCLTRAWSKETKRGRRHGLSAVQTCYRPYRSDTYLLAHRALYRGVGLGLVVQDPKALHGAYIGAMTLLAVTTSTTFTTDDTDIRRSGSPIPPSPPGSGAIGAAVLADHRCHQAISAAGLEGSGAIGPIKITSPKPA